MSEKLRKAYTNLALASCSFGMAMLYVVVSWNIAAISPVSKSFEIMINCYKFVM